jgi:hypothetical protein
MMAGPKFLRMRLSGSFLVQSDGSCPEEAANQHFSTFLPRAMPSVKKRMQKRMRG